MIKKLIVVAIIAIVTFVLAASAFAVGAGKTVEFAGGANGKVVFDGKTHADKGAKCNDCHPKVFQMKKGTTKITKADHAPGKFCGTCHDGKKAFDQGEADCAKCHKK